MFSWIMQIVVSLIEGILQKLNPQIAAYIEEAASVVIPLVQAAEESGAAGPEKKLAATTALIAEMHKRGFDPPGDIEDRVAGQIVEGAVTVLKKYGGDFFAGAKKSLTGK